MEYQKLNTLTLSEQAKREIHKYIKNMDLSRNNKLPREEVMAEMIGVSRITIRQAFNDLASEGIIFRRQGKGTFVNVDSLNIKVKFNPCMEFTQMIENSGYTPSVRLLNIQKIDRDEAICQQLQMESGEQLVVAEKMFLADDTVCAFCRDYFSLSLIGGEEAFREFSKYENSIFQYIYRWHISTDCNFITIAFLQFLKALTVIYPKSTDSCANNFFPAIPGMSTYMNSS